MLVLPDNSMIEQFIRDGFIRIDNAFSRDTAEAAVNILWKDLPVNRSDSSSWTSPVIWLGMYSQQPFLDSVNNPEINKIYDLLVGEGKWLPVKSVGSFPVRFPSTESSNDTGKHVDAGFPGNDPSDYFQWRINVRSRGRALLMLVLFSDVTEKDAPTLVYKGSHMDVARLLNNKGPEGMSFIELAMALDTLPKREEFAATGSAGTIYLCHPFLVHAAQAHRGANPKFMAQPPLFLREELIIDEAGNNYFPVAESIRRALYK